MTTVTPDTGTAAVETSRPLRKDAARNRELLVAAAREVFAQRGLDASLDEIAHHAGLGVGTAYRHFANKYELAQALMEQTIEQIVGALDEATAEPDPLVGLVSFLQAAMSAQAADRGLRQVLMGVHDPEKMQQVYDRLAPAILDMLERAKQSGQVRAEIEASDIGMIVSMLCTVADVAAEQSPELWRRYLAICLDGICTERSSGGVLSDHAALSDDDFRVAMAAYKGGAH
jgi:AcrR family transcriptional regulator